MHAERSKTCCFTGHRLIRLRDRDAIEEALDGHIARLARRGIQTFVSGGAIGFDMLAGFRTVEARRRCPHIQLILMLPCRDQDARWLPAQQAQYQALLEQADQVRYVSERYYDGCMQARNQEMVNQSATVIAYLRDGATGTGQTVRLARQAGLDVILL